MADDAIRLFQMLVEAGAKPGEDFSYNLQTASAEISDRAFEMLQAAYPDINWSSVCERINVDPAIPVEALNRYLGVEFTEQILTRIEQRISELPPMQATWYLQQVLGGVEHRTKIPLYMLLQRRMSLDKQMWLERLLRQPADPCYVWMSDLVEAAGGDPEDVEFSGDEATMTQAGLALLTAVWDGDYDIVAEEVDAEDVVSEDSSTEDHSTEDS
ncbi:hypothetical protein [cf. Phormidesmis sp. LEGE 11477]|uniref:hypothetical protein n=1 Tax=cf. Phormidesmis sp. LEGE 11477 TaxID=1828680 RepID=UPI001880D917|nr:hypothetical protein [cf. Phormidesmis sp. LEGE 11477]MBE9063097.1 hypothetical protein [cf. Phormidesmis sp. LEGE 11477]